MHLMKSHHNMSVKLTTVRLQAGYMLPGINMCMI